MSKKVIIGLHGRAGSGKDTAADYINQTVMREIGTDTCNLAFAKPLKDASKILFNFTDEQLYDTKLKEVVDERWGKSPRQILQWLGTDAIRKYINDDFFLKHMKQRIEGREYSYYTISDVRFPIEAQFVKDMDGIVIEILRDDTSTGGTEHSDHSSEKRLSGDLVDYTVENNGTVQEFHKKLDDIVTKFI